MQSAMIDSPTEMIRLELMLVSACPGSRVCYETIKVDLMCVHEGSN